MLGHVGMNIQWFVLGSASLAQAATGMNPSLEVVVVVVVVEVVVVVVVVVVVGSNSRSSAPSWKSTGPKIRRFSLQYSAKASNSYIIS